MLKPCLERKGITTSMIELIHKMYKNCKTTICSKNKEEVKIEIFRGVKQGDLLSPLLFNLCLEPLLEMIDENTDGININEVNKIPALVFADDIVFLGKDKMEAQNQLLEYLNNLGMNISVEKSLKYYKKNEETIF